MSLRLLCGSVVLLCASRALAQVTPPAAVEAVAIGPSEVRVYWDSVPGAEKYLISRDGRTVGEAPAGARTFVDHAPEAGRTYGYNVACVDSADRAFWGRPYVERTYSRLPAESRCDLLVVGANSAGVSAAVTAARYGMNVVLLEETRRIGGMAANGLGASDIRRPEHASGFFEEFRRKVQSLYGQGTGLKYEPRVAQQAMKEIVFAQPRLIVYRMTRPVKVVKQESQIAAVIVEELPSGRRATITPRMVVDATECGDVAAWAGAPFRVGREPRSKREPHAGHIFYDRAGDSRMPGSAGKGDRRIQAYSYLMTLKDHGPGDDRTISMPPGYDRSKYKGAPKWPDSWNATSGKLPNDKYEINQHPHGSDLQGVNYDYPSASYAERRRIESLMKDHALGYLYFMQTEQGMKNLGLSEEDYRDSDGWPALLYIREARRFIGDAIMDESDITNAREVARPDAIGIGDYAMDSHAAEPAPDFDVYAKGPKHMGEGEFYLPQYTPWHQVPYRIMIPKGLDNVFTPTAVSATHVAYGTYRMEPVRMHFGAAAGIAAYLCLRYDMTPRDVPVRQIQAELLKHESGNPDRPALDGIGAPGPGSVPAYLYMFSDVTPATPKYRAIQWLAARGFYPCPKPSQRTPAMMMAAAPFEPDASIAEREAARILNLLDRRRIDPRPLTLNPEPSTTNPVTRGEAAVLLARFMGWTAPADANHYADVPPGNPAHDAAEALYANWIDSRLWGIFEAYGPGEMLYFRPDQPITRAQFAELIYLAHIHIGPLWEDHPADRDPIPVP